MLSVASPTIWRRLEGLLNYQVIFIPYSGLASPSAYQRLYFRRGNRPRTIFRLVFNFPWRSTLKDHASAIFAARHLLIFRGKSDQSRRWTRAPVPKRHLVLRTLRVEHVLLRSRPAHDEQLLLRARTITTDVQRIPISQNNLWDNGINKWTFIMFSRFILKTDGLFVWGKCILCFMIKVVNTESACLYVVTA